jgi:hypothetical protein
MSSVPKIDLIPIISLWQPWASWVMMGWKTIETRTHQRFASLHGKRVGIHAAKKWDDDAHRLAWSYLTAEQLGRSDEFANLCGVSLGSVEVSYLGKLSALHSHAALIDCNDTERFGLALRNPVAYLEPIPCRGKQGIWYAPYEPTTQRER